MAKKLEVRGRSLGCNINYTLFIIRNFVSYLFHIGVSVVSVCILLHKSVFFIKLWRGVCPNFLGWRSRTPPKPSTIWRVPFGTIRATGSRTPPSEGPVAPPLMSTAMLSPCLKMQSSTYTEKKYRYEDITLEIAKWSQCCDQRHISGAS